MKRYDVDEKWDDPFEHQLSEHQKDRRVAPRFKVKFRLSITADDPEHHHSIVGPGIVRNISMSGILLCTKHQLEPHQRVNVEVPTSLCPEDLCLPATFEGTAQVIRVDDLEDGRSNVALCFGDNLSQNMEFAMFVDSLQAMARAMRPSYGIA